MGRIFGIGEALIDFIPQQNNVSLQDVSGFDKKAGGAPANVTVAASKLGAEAYFVGMVGKDGFGAFLIKELERFGVHTQYVFQTDRAKTSLAFVSLDESGQRDFSFYRDPGADMLLDETLISDLQLQKSDMVSFCSVDLVDYPVKYATMRLLEKANKAGAMVLFDPNVRWNLWKDHDALRETILEFLAYADLVKVSDDELAFITGTADEEGAIDFLKAKGVERLIVTRGKDGATAYFGNTHIDVPREDVRAIDTTGAGDAFVGATLWYIDQNDTSIDSYEAADIRSMLTFANKAASLSVTKHGAMSSFATREELQ